MTDAVTKGLELQLDSFSRFLSENYRKESPESGFAHYVFYHASSQSPLSVANDTCISTLAPSRFDQAPTIAAIGYRLACGIHFSDGFLENWIKGLARLSSREAFRPVELLGIVLGISHYYKNNTGNLEWVQKILIEGETRLAHSDLWTFLISAYAASILSVNWQFRSVPSAGEMTIDELALTKWFCCTADSSFSDRFRLNQMEEAISKALLERCVSFSISTLSSSHAALLYFALNETINQIIRLYWNNFEQVYSSPQAATEWFINTCNNIHTVTQYLQSCHSKESASEDLNVRTTKMLAQLLSRLRSDISIIETRINEQVTMNSSLFIGINQGSVNIGKNLIMPHSQKAETTITTSIDASHASIGVINSGSGTVSNFSQNISQNINEVSSLISSLREMAQQFPETQRQEALVTLDDLQEDVNNPLKQKPERINIRLSRLIAIAGTVTNLSTKAVDFGNKVLELCEKLGLDVGYPFG
jgi:hypothetical protein